MPAASRRSSFLTQVQEMQEMTASRRAGFGDGALPEDQREELKAEIMSTTTSFGPFESKFAPYEMRQLALVAHNHMKPAMKDFIQTFSEVLKKFRVTGTQTTMRMCKTLWGEDDPEVNYGLTCTSGPLGGDAQIAALMCIEDLGGMIFFVDPLSAHPHQADIDSLCRLTNCGNVIVCTNPTSAMSMMHVLKLALETGNRGMIPSFFETLESPAVAEYKHQQELALQAAVSGGNGRLRQMESMCVPHVVKEDDDEDQSDEWSCTDSDEDITEGIENFVKNFSGNTSKDGEEKKDNSAEEEGNQDGLKRRMVRQRETSMVNLYGIKEEQEKKKRSTLVKLGKVLTKKLSL